MNENELEKVMDYDSEMHNIHNKAIAEWGSEKQCHKAVEELSELIYAVSSHFTKGGGKEIVSSEIADVEIAIEQLKIMFDCREESLRKRNEKVAMLKELLDARSEV